MCELLAVCSRFPARINLSFQELACHGGWTGPHRDGWGVAYHDEGEIRMLREGCPAAASPWADLVARADLRSTVVVAHIRLATQGSRALRNTQPFARELGGRMHVFAHNGDLGDRARWARLPLGTFRPIGETDSEHAFCHLLGGLASLWLDSTGLPPLEERLAQIRRFADAIVDLGPSNFVYSDGDTVFVHGDCRRHDGEKTPRPPGLFALWRNFAGEEAVVRSSGLLFESDLRDQQAVLVASTPLSREGWIPLPRYEVLALRGGRLVASAARPVSVGV